MNDREKLRQQMEALRSGVSPRKGFEDVTREYTDWYRGHTRPITDRVLTLVSEEDYQNSLIAAAVRGKQNVIEIKRKPGVCGFELTAYADMTEEEFRQQLRHKAELYREEKIRKQARRRSAALERFEQELSRNAPCEPVTKADGVGKTDYGYRYLDDDGKWRDTYPGGSLSTEAYLKWGRRLRR